MVRRERALFATMKRFQGRGFKLGKFDCVTMVRAHAVAMGKRGLPRLPKYRDAKGAIEALKSQGVTNVGELMDKFFERIAPAAMLPGDVGLVETEKGERAWQAGTVVISVGRKWLAWPPASNLPLCVIDPSVERPFLAAWRL